MDQTPALKRGIRFRDLVLFYVVVVLSVRWTAAAATAGPSILIVWVAALFGFFIPLAASVMELSSRHPEEGGIYVWTREAFGDFSGFICAWTYWMSNLPFFAAVLYFGAASALFAFGPRAQGLAGNPLYYIAFSIFWLAAITLLNILGVDAGKWLNNIGALGSLVPLSVLILLGVVSYWRFGPATHITPASLMPHWSLNNAVFWSSVFFAFSAVEAASAMGDEIQNPRRTIPWALLAAGCVLAIGYIGGTAAFVFTLPSQAVAGPDGFVNGVQLLAGRLGLGWLLAPMALLVALNSVGGAAANLSSTARLPFVVGVDRYLPPAFGWIHPRFRTPWVAIAVYGAAGIVVALLGQAGTTVRGAYNVLVSMSVISLFIPYLFLFSAMIRMQSRPAGPQVRRVPGGKPVAMVLASMGLFSTAMTIILSIIPGSDEANKPLAVAKVLGATSVLVGAGVGMFVVALIKGKDAGKKAAGVSVS
jgi:amino acid transporter